MRHPSNKNSYTSLSTFKIRTFSLSLKKVGSHMRGFIVVQLCKDKQVHKVKYKYFDAN